MIGYPVAYYIARYGGRYRNALIALLVLPFFVNYLVRTYAWVALLADEGLVNKALVDLGPRSEPIQMINTPWAVIGGLTYGYLVFMILPVYGSLERLDRSVIEAGKDLYGTRCRRSSTSPCRRPSRGSSPARCSSSCPRSATSSPPSCSAAPTPTWSAT